MSTEREQILADLRERARYYATLDTIGVRRVAGAPGTAVPAASGGPAVGAPAAEQLQAVREWLGDCQRCRLAGGRKNIVFGQGSANARLMFVGEAPGGEED